MRLSLILIYVLVMACSTTETMDSQSVERCSVTDCFNRHQVRDYEVVGDSKLLLYVGPQRCPFLVEFGGAFCDLTFLPGGNVNFRSMGVTSQLDMRICAGDTQIGIDNSPFNVAPGTAQNQIGRIGDINDNPLNDNNPFNLGGGPVARRQLPCQLQNVASLTDDQVLELFVENGIAAPPPPFGTGEIQVKDELPGAEQGVESGEASPEVPAQPTAAITPDR